MDAFWEDGVREALELSDEMHLWHPLTQHAEAHPLIIERGEGSTVFSADGRAFLDAAAGLWCVNVGYGRRELIDAGSRQLEALAYYPLTQSHPAAIRLSERLARLLPRYPRWYFSNSGSEANEIAFKAVRQYWRQVGRPDKVKILSRARGYHGATLGALSATGQAERRRDYGPFAPGFIQVTAPYCYRCPFHLAYPSCGLTCAADFERRIQIEGADTVAAIIVEPVGAGGGVLVTPPDYLAEVAAVAQKYEVKLIVDEVVTGFGRTGAMFAHPAHGVEADVVTVAKGLASGYMPIGATGFSAEIFEAFLGDPDSGRHFRHVNTFGGHPVAAAVSLANIAVLEGEGLAERSARIGAELLAQLRESLLESPWVGDVRGQGLLLGVELVVDRGSRMPVSNDFMRSVARSLVAHGVIAGKSTDIEAQHNNVLMFAPPLIITEDECEMLVNTVSGVIADVGERSAMRSASV